MSGRLILPGLSLPFQEIPLSPHAPPKEWHEVFQFCKDWMEGKEEFILHTSGSTGTPKPIHLSRSQMEASARMTLRALDLTRPGLRALICLPTRYIGGKMMLVRCMVGDMDAMVVPPDSNPYQFLDTPVDFVAMVPLQLQTLLDKGSPKDIVLLQNTQVIILGGGPVSPSLVKQLQSLTPRIFNTYGMTETVSHIALRQLNGPEARPWFTTLPQTEIDMDARGCLRIKSPVTKEEWITTNDQVSILGPNRFEWLGRADFVVNTGGIKISVESLEKGVNRIMTSLQITQRYFFTGIPDSLLGERLVLVVEGQPLGHEKEHSLLVAIERQEGRYSRPKEILYLHELIETETGKIKRQESLELAIAQKNFTS
jgi:o-succinylbenzoate---CoA ligase